MPDDGHDRTSRSHDRPDRVRRDGRDANVHVSYVHEMAFGVLYAGLPPHAFGVLMHA